MRTLLRHLCLLIATAVLLTVSWSHAAEPGSPLERAAVRAVVLGAGADTVVAWPSVTMLKDPGRQFTVEEVRRRIDWFEVPTTPFENLGAQRNAVWLRIPIEVRPGDPGRWVLQIDYATLDRIDVHLLDDGAEPRHAVLGDNLPYAQRPLPSRSPAVALQFEPGRHYEMLLRIETTSSMVLPIRFFTPEAFLANESSAQMLQGLLTGLGLCLLIYSLAHWASLRDAMFIYYAITVGGSTVFFLTFFGLGPQHLWPEQAWLTANLAPLSVLVLQWATCRFCERALRLPDFASHLLKAVSWLILVVAVAFIADLIGYRMAQLIASLIGPTPLLVALPTAYRRARNGDKAGLYMLFGWGFFAASAFVAMGLLRGLLPVNLLTLHAFQFGSMFEMIMWMRVLGVRIDNIRQSAQRAQIERDTLRSLAHTDALTGLPNRRGLNESLQRLVAASSDSSLCAVYLLDLDGFKAINDRHGHDIGDELLVAVGARLRSVLRPGDVLARLGGDEFVVVAPNLGTEPQAERLGRSLVAVINAPFDLSGRHCTVGLTVGYSLSPRDGSEPTHLLREADAAMYAGKQAGRRSLRRAMARPRSAQAVT